MGTGAAGALSSTAYVGWKEAFFSSDKGAKEVHYYLMRRDGDSDLAVVGKERSPSHITYRYVVQDKFVIGGSFPQSFVKLRSREAVIDWLNSIVSECPAAVDINTGFGSFDERDAGFLTFGRAVKDVQIQKFGQYGKQCLWLGSSWMCKKKRTHYQSFCRNGVKISVNNFVFVLAEENKHLVALLEDMYEDFQGNKMVLVRWFHRIDEVDIDLPHKFNDREVFFSLCLQDLKIECIDGIATVLNPLHFDKYLKEVRDSWIQPFVCQRLFDDCDIKPFDVTQIKGYWSQEILCHMYSSSVPKMSEKIWSPDKIMNERELVSCPVMSRPRKRLRLLRDSINDMPHGSKKGAVDNLCLNGKGYVPKVGGVVTEKQPSCFAVGCQVEVLSQDSGMRGCWFRTSVVKKHKDKIKVRYDDIQDADDEVNNLEEWVSSSRIAAADNLGLRINGRTMVRPLPEPHNGRVSWAYDVGCLVDAWWHDGWWEGIVIHRDCDEKVRVYFPGEKRESVFCVGELRHSQEWVGNGWKDLHGRADFASKIQSDLISGGRGNEIETRGSKSEAEQSENEIEDISKDKFLAKLQWKSWRKRSRSGHHFGEKNSVGLYSRSNQRLVEVGAAKALKVSIKKCKYMGDPVFSNSVPPPPVRSLIMSR